MSEIETKYCNLVVLSHDVSIPLSTHRSIEFRKRMESFSSYFRSVHILSWDSLRGKSKKLIPAAENSNISITKLRGNFIENQMLAYDAVQNCNAVLADSLSDLFKLLPVFLLSRRKPTILLQGYVIEEYIQMLRKSLLGMLLVPLFLFIGRLLEMLAFSLSSIIIVISKGLRQHAASRIGKSWKQKLVWLPMALAYLRLPSKEQSTSVDLSVYDISETLPKIVCVGRLVESKRIDVVIKAFNIVLKKQNAVLIVIGEGGERKKLQELAESLGISKSTFFLGRLERTHAISIMSKCNVLVSASISEGFGLAIYEALSVGCTVVAYQFKGAKSEGLGDAVYLIPTQNPTDYATSILQLLDDEVLRKRIIRDGQSFVSKYIGLSEEERHAKLVDLIRCNV